MNVGSMTAHVQAAIVHFANTSTQYVSGGSTAHALKFSLT
jgi:hypothetical protein